jgi:hypothetical protein
MVTFMAGFNSFFLALRVADIWESEQDLNNYFNSRLKPVMEKINAPNAKGGNIYASYVNAYQGTDTYRVK